MLSAALALTAAGAIAADGPTPGGEPRPAPEPKAASDELSPWFVRAGVLRALYNSSASISSNGQHLADSSAGVTDSLTLNFDVGYQLTDRLSVMLMGGIPPTASVIGKGGVAPFGTLGKVSFGPVTLTSVYRLPAWHGFRPYAGGGGAHLFILKSYDRSVSQLKVRDSWGFVLEGGIEREVGKRVALFADYKHIWLAVNARGELGGAPIRARVTLDPDVVSAGIRLNFRK